MELILPLTLSLPPMTSTPETGTHPNASHCLSAVVAYVHRDCDLLPVPVNGSVQGRTKADTTVLQQKRLVHRTLGATSLLQLTRQTERMFRLMGVGDK